MFRPLTQAAKFRFAPLSFLTACQARHGDYHLLRLGRQRVHLIFDPALARSILGDALTFKKNAFVYDKIKPITGESGLVQIEGQEGLDLRAAFNRFFSQSALDGYLAAARGGIERGVPSLEGTRDVREAATEMVLGTALSMFAGAVPGTEAAGLSRCFLRLNELCGKEFKNLLPVANPLRRRAIRRAQAELDRAVDGILDSPREGCLIGQVRAASGSIPAEVTERFLADQVKTFLFAGHETTATYLIMALYELSRDPDLQERVREELAASDAAGEATRRFLREILRLYPPAWMIVRESTSAGEIDGRAYLPGDYLFIGVHQIHRHPQHWTRPDELHLEHHAEKNIAFMPYGAGKRHCIGSRLADLELAMILAAVLRRFRLEYRGGGDKVRCKVMITAYPADPVKIHFEKR